MSEREGELTLGDVLLQVFAICWLYMTEANPVRSAPERQWTNIGLGAPRDGEKLVGPFSGQYLRGGHAEIDMLHAETFATATSSAHHFA